MTKDEKDRAIDMGYYKGIDLDAETYTPVAFEKVDDGYVLKFKETDGVFDVEVSSGLLSRVLRGLRTHRLGEIEKKEKLQGAQTVATRRGAQ